MFETHEEAFYLRTCDCDCFGAWTPWAILEAMQETAGAHTRRLKLGMEELREWNLAWIVSRARVKFDRVPRLGEMISVETFPSNEKRLFFPRTHVFRDADGCEIGTAGALWLLMDIETRRITLNDRVLQRMPENRRERPFLFMPEGVKPLIGEKETGRIAPLFSDFDVNGHVNNTRYMRWCADALGMERMKKQVVNEFNVCYEAEIGESMCVETELTVNDTEFSYFGNAEGKRRFCVSGRLQAR